MKATPASPLRPEHADRQHSPAEIDAGRGVGAPELDLETRILRAEQRLMLRETAVRSHVALLTERVQRMLQPRHMLRPALGGLAVVLAAVGLWRLARGKRKGRSAAQQFDGGGQRGKKNSGHGRQLPWVRMLGLAWPLLPGRLRGRVNPGTVSTVLSLGLPLVEQMLARRVVAPLATASHVDLERYAGTWFQVARLPSMFGHTDAGDSKFGVRLRHVLQPDGSLTVTRRSRQQGALHQDTVGVMRPPVGSGSGDPRLQFSAWPHALQWLPMAWSEHWVVHLDGDYSEALVGSPDRRALWLLSRRPHLPPDRVQALVQIAREQGFDVDKLDFDAHFGAAP